jgi:phage antirepressor YoqD-like protein
MDLINLSIPNHAKLYFDKIFDLEKNGEKFPVNFNDVWSLAYTKKANAVKDLKAKFIEGVDYFLLIKNDEQTLFGRGGHNQKNYLLTTSCLEYFIVRKEREVFNIYRECRKKLQVNQIPTSFAEALQLAANLEKEKEILRIQAIQDKPKVEFFDAVTGSKDAKPFGDIAKVLGYKKVGRNKLFSILRKEGILMDKNIPYQKYIDLGYFKLIETKFQKPDGTTCINIKTLILQKGVNYIMKKLNSLGYEKIAN